MLCGLINVIKMNISMWGMYDGLRIARRQGFLQLMGESDSKLLVDMVIENCKINGLFPF